MLCSIMLCYVMLCSIMLCYVCYVMLHLCFKELSYFFQRETHGTGVTYHEELAKQLASFLKDIIEVNTGVSEFS